MKYSRSFITLTQLEEDFVISGKTAIGKAVVEIRNDLCKIFIWVQNLKPNIFYNLFLIYRVNDKNYGVYITDIFVNENGRGELKYSFNIKDIFQTNFQTEDFVSIALVIDRDNKTSTPIIGYREKEIPWNNDFINLTIEKKEKKRKNVVYKKDNELKSTHVNFKNYISDFEDSIKEIEKTEFKYKNKLKTNPYNCNELFNNLKTLIDKNINLEPFECQSRNVSWVRVSIDDLDRLSFFNNVLSENLIQNAYKNYKHLILGYVDDYSGETFYFGVPEMFDSKQKQLAYSIGFMQFKCCDFKKPEDNAYGYWIMSIK